MKQISKDIQSIEQDRLELRTERLRRWAAGENKQTLNDLLDLLNLYRQLTSEQTRELADLRSEQQSPPEKLLFQLSTPARRRY